MSRIVVATPSEGFVERIGSSGDLAPGDVEHVWREGLQMGDIGELADEIVHHGPGVVVVGPGLRDEAAIRLVEAVDRRRPDAVTVVVADASDGLWPAALRAGVRDILPPGIPDDDLREAVARALGTAQQRQAALTLPEETTRGRVLVVVSPKGGAGKTTIASNLAVGLAQSSPGEVVLIDLDLQFGGVANALHMTPEHSIADAARVGPSLDAATLKVFLSAHESGLFVLTAPESLAQADEVGAEQLSRIVSLLADTFRYVLIDTAAGIDVVTLAAIELATDLVLVTTTDVPCVRALRRATDALETIGVGTPTRHLVVNRSDVKGGLSLADVSAVTGEQIAASVPDSREIALSLNLGAPIVVADPRSGPAKAIGGLVELVLGRPREVPRTEPARASGRRFRRSKERS